MFCNIIINFVTNDAKFRFSLSVGKNYERKSVCKIRYIIWNRNGKGCGGHWSLVNGHLSMVLLLLELALELELLQRLRSLLSLRSIERLFIGI